MAALECYTMAIILLLAASSGICDKAPNRHKQPTYKPQQSTSSFSTRKVVNNKKLFKLAEQKFLGFLGLKERASNYTRHNVKVPEHLWKIYYKWSDENYQDKDKENADTARLFYHNGEYILKVLRKSLP